METKHIGFTICTKSYLAGALIWRNSLINYETAIRGLIYVVDAEAKDLPELCSEAKTICLAYADGLENDLRSACEDDIPDNLGMRERYNTIEYCTAIKPSIFLKLARQFPDCVLHYFDPDISVFGNLLELRKFSELHSITLTPHMTTPTEDNFRLSQLSVLRAGVFNFGYIGWNPTIKSGWPLINWWQKMLNKNCRVALEEGIFTDQSWGVFFCSSPEVGILHDLAYNVAYWNLHERNLDWTAQSGYTCNGKRLQFFHFSGYSPTFPSRLSLHQDRHQLDGLRGVSKICSEYSKELRLTGFETWKQKHTTLKSNNQKINSKKGHEKQKHLMDSASACIYFAFKDPNHSRILYGISYYIIYIVLILIFIISSIKSFITKGVSHNKAEEYVNKNYISSPLIRKGIIYWVYRIYIKTKSLFNNLLRPESIEDVQEIHIKKNFSSSSKDENDVSLAITELSNERDIAVIGYITAETGLGESVRGIIRSIDKAHLSADLYDLRRHYARSMDEEFSNRICDDSGPVKKYKTCIVHVNADQVPHILAQMPGSLLKMAEHRIGYWYWETETLPHGQAAAANYFDEIWVATEFVREALISSGVKIPVWVIPPALSNLPDASFGKNHFNLPEDRLICLSVFDATSFLGRKNPKGVIQSLKKIYAEEKINPLLVLKTTNLKESDKEELIKFASPVELHIINQYLSREETLSLIALADCFVSLHRAEGLGLSLIDAMRLGTPLVSTDYSGPKDFTGEETAFLVPWKYCFARWEDGPYYGSQWADPDLNIAASQIVTALHSGIDRNTKIANAKKHVNTHFSRQRISDLIIKKIKYLE